MPKKTGAVLVSFIFLLNAGPLSAETWKILGPRPLGMGGAFVAMAQGNIAQYWNPAGLALEMKNRVGIEIPAGAARAEFTGGVLKEANTLGDLASKYSALQAAQSNQGSVDADLMAAYVKGLAAAKRMDEPEKGVLVDVAGGVGIRAKRWALSAFSYTSIGGDPNVDTQNVGMGTVPGDGTSGVTFSGADGTTIPGDTASRDKIKTGLDTISGGDFTVIDKLVCGSAGCINGQEASISDATTLSNALINLAVANSVSAQQIAEAADTISQNSSEVAPIVQNLASGNGKPYSQNDTNLTLRGASFTELALGYARPLGPKGLLVGGNLKAVLGSVGYNKFRVMQEEAGTTEAVKDYDANSKTSVQPSVDLGLLYELDQAFPKIKIPLHPRVGLTARNLNRPKFKQPDAARQNGEGSKYPLDTQVRMGVAVTPLKFWNIAADLDLTNNKTPVPGLKSRMVGLGTEFNVFNRSWLNIPLRAGIMKNLSESGSKPAYTAGFGLNFLHVIVDVGGSVSSERTQVEDQNGDSKKVPSNVAVAAQLAILF